jgi:hypothetical protein
MTQAHTTQSLGSTLNDSFPRTGGVALPDADGLSGGARSESEGVGGMIRGIVVIPNYDEGAHHTVTGFNTD